MAKNINYNYLSLKTKKEYTDSQKGSKWMVIKSETQDIMNILMFFLIILSVIRISWTHE